MAGGLKAGARELSGRAQSSWQSVRRARYSAAAPRYLATKGLSETVNAALREAARRRALRDFDVVRDVDGTPQEVAEGRESS